jgi:hypothetical protein
VFQATGESVGEAQKAHRANLFGIE